MIKDVMKALTAYDKEVGEAMELEFKRQSRNLELIASENIVSEPVMMAMGSILTNKYAEGYPGKRYYGGCENVDIIEQIAIDRAKELFGCEYANVQPHSGAQANMAVFFAMLEPGDTVLGMNLAHGGHLTHGSPVNMSGKYFNVVPYGVNDEGFIDYDELRKIALETKPKLIIAGASAYARKIDFKKFREVADECGAYLMVDMAHIAGLVAAGLHESPIPYADVVTTTTHKTLRGPRGGLILSNSKINEKFNFNNKFAIGYRANISPLKDNIEGDLLTESRFYTIVGPRDLKVALSYDFVRDVAHVDFMFLIGSDSTKIDFNKLTTRDISGAREKQDFYKNAKRVKIETPENI